MEREIVFIDTETLSEEELQKEREEPVQYEYQCEGL